MSLAEISMMLESLEMGVQEIEDALRRIHPEHATPRLLIEHQRLLRLSLQLHRREIEAFRELAYRLQRLEDRIHGRDDS